MHATHISTVSFVLQEYYDIDFLNVIISVLIVAVFTKWAYDALVSAISDRLNWKEAPPLYDGGEEANAAQQ